MLQTLATYQAGGMSQQQAIDEMNEISQIENEIENDKWWEEYKKSDNYKFYDTNRDRIMSFYKELRSEWDQRYKKNNDAHGNALIEDLLFFTNEEFAEQEIKEIQEYAPIRLDAVTRTVEPMQERPVTGNHVGRVDNRGVTNLFTIGNPNPVPAKLAESVVPKESNEIVEQFASVEDDEPLPTEAAMATAENKRVVEDSSALISQLSGYAQSFRTLINTCPKPFSNECANNISGTIASYMNFKTSIIRSDKNDENSPQLMRKLRETNLELIKLNSYLEK